MALFAVSAFAQAGLATESPAPVSSSSSLSAPPAPLPQVTTFKEPSAAPQPGGLLTASGTSADSSRDYYFPWYDFSGMQSWVLMSNPAGSGSDLIFDLSIGTQKKDLNAFALSGASCPAGQCSAGQVPAGMTLTPSFPGVLDGPVKASSLTGDKAIVSQRSLMGSSFEEVPATEAERRSSHFYWTWYDQKSPGVSNWVMIANPGTEGDVYYEVTIAGQDPGPGSKGTIAPGKSAWPTFPGQIGGPVEVRAYTDDTKTTEAEVIASQRVLSGYGSAFNEMPGIPKEELSDHYLWSWYDSVGSGGQNWVMLANPSDTEVSFDITIAGQTPAADASGTIAPGGIEYRVFNGKTAGPVEVTASANIIASQRIVWGPSFGEVAGYPYDSLASSYHWTWYDMQSSGSSNWVMVSNPGTEPVYYEITIAGGDPTPPGCKCSPFPGSSGTIEPGKSAWPTFPGLMKGPVEVRAYTDETKTTPADVMASQRVVWNGHFNEVAGTLINPELTPVTPETTQVLDDATSEHLTSVSGDGTDLTFTGTAEETAPVSSLSPGDIVVVDPNPSAPNGALRKVEGVDATEGQVSLTTSQATLEEAVEQGSLRADSDDIASAPVPATLSGGATVASYAGLGTYSIPLDKVLYDADGDHSTTIDQVKAQGSISISPGFEFDVDVRGFKIDRVLFVDKTTETASLSVTAGGSVGFSKEWEVWSQRLAPVSFAIGPVPVWITPVVHVYVGADGEVHAQLTTSVTQQASFSAGLEYDRGNWRPISGFSNSFTYQPPVLTAGGSLKAYAGVQLDLMLYDVVGPHANVDGYLKLNVDLINDPWWVLYGGLDAGVGVKFSVLGRFEKDFSKSFNIMEREIAKADNATDPPPPPNSGPTVTNVQPSGTISTTSTSISADYSDPDGIDTSSVSVTLDGNALTGCTVTAARVSCPASGLASGIHTIGGHLRDSADNLSLISGSFSVVPGSGQGTQKLTDDGYSDWEPQINASGQVVWVGYDGPDGEIFLYTPGQGTQKLTDNSHPDSVPQINASGQVVWRGGFNGADADIFLYTPGQGTKELTDKGYSDGEPQINASGQVVWRGSDGTDSEIFQYTPGAGIDQLTNNTVDDDGPQMNDRGEVVWVTSGEIGGLLLYAPGVGTLQLTNYAGNQEYDGMNYGGMINNAGQVVFTAQNGWYPDVFLYTPGSGIVNVTNSTSMESKPQINSVGQVVWQAYGENGGTHEIFLYTPGSGTVQLTYNALDDVDPKLNDAGQVVWQGEDISYYYNYYDSQVFLYSPEVGIIQLTSGYPNTGWGAQINVNGQVVWHQPNLNHYDHPAEIYLYTP